jgi:hypothetical protein
MTKNGTPRQAAISKDGTGLARYSILKEGATQASKAFIAGFYIESIMITEGMLWCRVASRYHYVVHKQATNTQGLKSLMAAATAADETPAAAEFASVFSRITTWLDQARNPLAHGAAKRLDLNGPSFAENMERARVGAEAGFQILVDLESLDLQARLTSGWQPRNPGSQVRPPASHPDAFDSIREIVQQPSAQQLLAKLTSTSKN